MRPADANEVAEAWRVVSSLKHEPACLILSRQSLPTLDRTRYAPASGVRRGAYVLADAANGKPDVILIGTGSEVGLCVEVYEKLTAEGIAARRCQHAVMGAVRTAGRCLSRERFCRLTVTRRVAVEQASTLGWERYTGLRGTIIGMRTFGASAPLKELLVKFGFTGDNVYAAAKAAAGAQGVAAMPNPLRTLQEYGQSVWLDFVSRDLLKSGGLAKLIARGRAARRHLEPVDLRKGDRPRRRLRRADRQPCRLPAISIRARLFERLAVTDIQDGG